jgi:hypothetical protein
LAHLIISDIRIQRTSGKSRLCADIHWRSRTRSLWFEVDHKYEEYLSTERADAFLVALLPFAMLNNLNMRVDASVSEKLIYQVKTILVPTLTAHIVECHSIDIEAKCDATVLNSTHGVATALSCGVDSFYTVLKHLNGETKGFNLSHLTYFNIMNHSQWKLYGEDASRDFTEARIRYVSPVAKRLGLQLVEVDTNFDVFYHEYALLSTATFRYFAVVLALQKLFGKYYWSSSYSFSQFDIVLGNIAHFDLLSVYCLSNENTEFYSTGSEATRLEKTAYISDFDITYRYLNVCWKTLYNCNTCDKCKRTMLTLYALGKLDLYNEVFDVKRFYHNIHEYLGYMLFMRDGGGDFYEEIYQCMLKRGIQIPHTAESYARKLDSKSLWRQIKGTIKILADLKGQR